MTASSALAAAVFDMDGVLLDSEPFWQDAEIDVFHSVGIQMDRAMAIETMGMRINEVVALRYSEQPWSAKTLQQVEDEILQQVVDRVLTHGEALPGVNDAIEFLQQQGLRLALASSSYEVLIDAVLERLKLQNVFELTYSAQHEQFGKPHPAVYLTTADKLGLSPAECVAIEDSENGMKSALAAGYHCIAVPAPEADKQLFGAAGVVLDSLTDLNADVLTGLTTR